MPASVLILLYCLLIASASVAGGLLPALIKLTHLRSQLLISVVSGVMLGVAALHLLPHSINYLSSGLWVGGCLLCGLLFMFFLLRVFQTHPHDLPAGQGGHQHSHPLNHHHAAHDHGHHHVEGHAAGKGQKSDFSWAGAFIGMTLHSLLDGVALAASVYADVSAAPAAFPLLGLGTFLAIFLHKPLDALAIVTLMQSSDTAPKPGAINLLFALTCPLGALAFWSGAMHLVEGTHFLIGGSLAFSAGFFLCIALSDLLPEVAFHSHDRGKLSAALLLGVGLAVAVELLHLGAHRESPAAPALPTAYESQNDAPTTHTGGEQ